MSKIKESIQSGTPKESKLQLLSLLPSTWSVKKIQEETGATRRLVEKMRKNSYQAPTETKSGNQPLAKAVENLVKQFYENDEYSRILPGIKDYVTVKNADGTKSKEQKRLVLCNINELYSAFKDKHPSVKIGFSKFASLRPKNCCLAGAPGTHTVCVCTLHQNVKLMLEGCKFPSILVERPGPEMTYRTLLESLICSNPSDDCWYRKCSECQSTKHISDMFESAFQEQEIEEITFKTWISTDRCNLITSVCSSEEFITTLIGELEKLLPHDFIVKKQASYYNQLKIELKPLELIVVKDFAENYAFTVQEAAPGFHWNNDQATVYPVVIYFKENDELKHVSFMGISDCLKHDAVSVYMFQQKLINFLKNKFENIILIHYFSDGAPQQFKNKEAFINLVFHRKDFQIEAVWNFFPTAHGKGPCDGLGGIVKRRAKLASLKMGTKDQILTPHDLYTWVKTNILNVYSVFCTNEDYSETENLLRDRFQKAVTVKGTKSFHNVVPASAHNMILCRKYSDCEVAEKIRIFR